MEERATKTELMFEYEAARGAEARSSAAALRLQHVQRLERLRMLEEKQRSDLGELRARIECISRHTAVIRSALRNADESEAEVAVCSSIVRDVLAVRANIEQSIRNSVQIKRMLGADRRHLMEALLARMDTQLNNWTAVLNVASRNLLNSRALVENIQNVIVIQQQMCSEVIESDLFANLNSALNSTSIENLAENVDLIETPQNFCSTPAGN